MKSAPNKDFSGLAGIRIAVSVFTRSAETLTRRGFQQIVPGNAGPARISALFTGVKNAVV